MILYHRRIPVNMILPVGIGINGGVSSVVIAPGVDGGLGETGGLPVSSQSCILNLHKIGIVGDQIQTFSYLFKREIAAVRNFGTAFVSGFCGNQDHSVGSPRTVDGRRSGIFQYRNVFYILGIDITDSTTGYAIDHHERIGIIQCTDTPDPDRRSLETRGIPPRIGYGQS